MPALRMPARIALLGSATLVVGLLMAAPAVADLTQSIDVSVSPSKRGSAAKLTLRWRTSDTRRVKPAQPRKAVYSLPKGVGFDRRAAAKTCSSTRILAGRSCPKGSTIGGGRAFLDVRAGGFNQFSVPVQAFMATRQGRERARILVKIFEPQTNQKLILTGVVATKKAGDFDTQLRFDSIPALAPVQGSRPSLIGLDLALKAKRTRKISGHKRTFNFFRNPRRCSGGAWPYQGTFSFASGLTLKPGDTVACS